MTPDSIKQASTVRTATAEEIEAVEWATEARRKQLGSLGEALQRLVVLETAVLGGSAALLNQVPAPAACKSLAVIFILASLALSLFGVNPLSGQYHPNCPEEIIAARQRGIRIRSRLLFWSCGLLFAGFAVIVGGMIGKL
jgi:hypothetical protein